MMHFMEKNPVVIGDSEPVDNASPINNNWDPQINIEYSADQSLGITKKQAALLYVAAMMTKSQFTERLN